MARHLAMGLLLVACLWLLASTGCSTNHEPVAERDQDPIAKQNQEPGAKQGRPPSELRTLPEQALSLWQRDIDDYRRYTKDPEALRPQAEEFMRAVQLGMLPHPRGPGYAKTAEIGKRLFEQGCQDPLLKTYYARAIYNDRGIVDAFPVLLEALNARDVRYAFECKRTGMFMLMAVAKDYSGGMDWPRLRKEVAGLAAQRVGDATIGPEMRRLVYQELRPLVVDRSAQNWEDAVAIYEACRALPKADPWIIHMLAGRAHESRAWHHRGVGVASEVPPEAWKPFHENLGKAAEQYAKAQKLHPECPEAAAAMIGVAMASESDETPQAWFDKAVAAEIDYMPAYERLRWALRPRWGGSHDAMYQFGCRCADTRRYDTMVPFVLLQVLNDIDEELGYNCQVWRRKGVYARVKEVLEGMAKDPSRADGAGVYPTRSSVMSLHVALAERAGEYKDARRLADGLGDRFDRRIFALWCAHAEFVLADVYAFTGKGAQHIAKAWQTLDEASKPYSDQVLEKARDLFQKALAADDNERSSAYCRARLAEMEGRLGFSAGKWFEIKFDPAMLRWCMADGTWSRENDTSAVGHPRSVGGRVLARPFFVPLFPLEIEFDVEAPTDRERPSTLGLFVPEGEQSGVGEKPYHQFFVRTYDNLAGIEISGESKTVPCALKPVNRIRVQLADGRAVLHVNGRFCLERSEEDFHPQAVFDFGCHTRLFPQSLVRVSNVRIRKWEPPKDEAAPKKEEAPKKEQAAPKKDEAAPKKGKEKTATKETTRKKGE